MKKSNRQLRVILAVDLKAGDPKLTQRIWGVLGPLFKSTNTVVEPVSILNREDAALGNFLKDRIGKLGEATERHLGELLAEQGLQGLAPAKVIFADGSSTQRAVMALLGYAKKTKCDLIAVSSHSKRGVKRLFLGSFAETLSLQSPIPLLIVKPHERVSPERFKTILFPTDFSAKSKAGLEIVCKSFGSQKPKIILFNSYVFPVQSYMEPFASLPLPQSVFDDEFKKAQKLGRQWLKQLRAKGIASELVIDKKSTQITEGILSVAKRKKAGLIAVVSTTGKIGATLMGSVTRQVIRESPLPVWVVHPR